MRWDELSALTWATVEYTFATENANPAFYHVLLESEEKVAAARLMPNFNMGFAKILDERTPDGFERLVPVTPLDP